MLDRIKRKLSRAKSAVNTEDLSKAKSQVDTEDLSITQSRTLSLTPSDEQLISKLSFTPDTQIIERPPRYQAPSVETRWSERTVYNNTDSGLLSLPTEILLFLQPYLRPSSEVALRHTCSRFFHLYTLPFCLLSGQDKFEFCCMKERDQDPKELGRLVCGKCRDLHPKSGFASAEIAQPPLERDCRQIWLCPHRCLGYRKTIKTIKAGVDSPFRAENIEPCSRCRETVRNRSIAERPEKGTREIDIEHPRSDSMLITKIAIMQRPSPSHLTKGMAAGMYRETFPAKDVSDALQAINFRICPHLCLGDPSILSKFCRACINTQKLAPDAKGPPCISESKKEYGDFSSSEKCKGQCYFRGCKTKFMFQARESISPDASGKRQVWLIISVYRWLGPLLSSGRDATWLEHSVDNAERVEMRTLWDKWEKSKARKFMPNWSICLLHPDDCKLSDFSKKSIDREVASLSNAATTHNLRSLLVAAKGLSTQDA